MTGRTQLATAISLSPALRRRLKKKRASHEEGGVGEKREGESMMREEGRTKRNQVIKRSKTHLL